MNRFLIYKKKLKPALETYAKYCTWRETNLPIDPASCQTELDRGLMVPHGVDVEGRKVLWFLAAKQAKGVWDLDEVIRAFVHQVRSTSCIDVSSEATVASHLPAIAGRLPVADDDASCELPFFSRSLPELASHPASLHDAPRRSRSPAHPHTPAVAVRAALGGEERPRGGVCAGAEPAGDGPEKL